MCVLYCTWLSVTRNKMYCKNLLLNRGLGWNPHLSNESSDIFSCFLLGPAQASAHTGVYLQLLSPTQGSMQASASLPWRLSRDEPQFPGPARLLFSTWRSKPKTLRNVSRSFPLKAKSVPGKNSTCLHRTTCNEAEVFRAKKGCGKECICLPRMPKELSTRHRSQIHAALSKTTILLGTMRWSASTIWYRKHLPLSCAQPAMPAPTCPLPHWGWCFVPKDIKYLPTLPVVSHLSNPGLVINSF